LDPADPDRICRIGLLGIQLSSEAPRESIVGSKDFRRVDTPRSTCLHLTARFSWCAAPLPRKCTPATSASP